MHAISKVERILRAFSGKNPLDDFEAAYTSQNSHIAIGGCGRSGTTLVRVILDSHPHLCCGPESKLFLQEPLDIHRLQEKFKLDASNLEQLTKSSRSRAEFIDRFAELCCTLSGKRRWTEKTPRNILNLDYIFHRFPEARFVHVLRDGRDVACSLREHPRHRVENGKLVRLNTWNPMDMCAERWRDSIEAAKRYQSDPRFHTVRYEGLVSDPKATISSLLRILGEDWDAAVLAHSSAESNFRDANTFPQNPEALEPIGTSAVARWERDMTEEDKRIFKRIAGDLLVECGYANNGNW